MQTRSGSIIRESTKIALTSIWAHKLRTFLTLLGIIIGVASVMVVGAGIDGLQTYVTDSVSSILGSNSFIIDKYAHMGDMSEEEWELILKRNKDIKMEHVEFVKNNCPDCEVVVGEINTVRSIFFESEEIKSTNVTGATSRRILLGNQEIVEGRYFNDQEVRRSRYVCVIGWDLFDNLFQETDALGKVIKLGNEPFTVIGILEKMGSSFGQSLDNEIHIPITAFQKVYGSRRSITIRGTAVSKESFESTLDQARSAMRVSHKVKPGEEDTFGIISTEEINSFVDDFTGIIAMVVIPITLISLVVGGIVVMNIMLVSVTERTFEIGLRKALGATRQDILNQFLIESFVLAASGGLIGLITATVVSVIIELTTPMTMTVSWFYALLSIGVSGGIGLIFGIYPAYSASKLDPIEALREEK